MARKKGYKYPRLTILVVAIILTFFIFSRIELSLAASLPSSNVVGAFISGLLYAFSFTAFISTSLFLSMESGNIITLGLAGGMGSVIADLIIFKTARVSFAEEFERLYKEPIFSSFFNRYPKPLLHTIKIIAAVIIIASPLPDEAGVTLLANGYTIPRPVFIILSYTLNTIGIFSILLLGRIF